MKNKSKVYLALGLVVLVGTLIFSLGGVRSFENIENFDGDMKLYKSPSCGCCEVYSSYFKRSGNSKLDVINVPDTNAIMREHGIPPFLESCHTIIIGDYFVEGHVPLEAIEKLLSEKPDISGIGMSGMPEGSPGMPGTKRGDFVIQGINHDGSSFEFMRI